ncbi:MAG: ATP-binding protein [Clostridiaceae bacterium]|nr:ATP-binding protein [Clostridiaceae bacterium]
MAAVKIEVEAKGIKRALKKFDTYSSIAQYIWNGFDAKASSVSVDFMKNQYGSVSGLSVKDNGHGIDSNQLPTKFKNIFTSNKAGEKSANKNSSDIHGENGIGRFTFFTFCDYAVWTTVYEQKGKRYKYTITISSINLDEYDPTDIIETEDPVGTVVEFYNFGDDKFNYSEFYEYMQLEFAWFLELNRENVYQLLIDGEPINYNSLIKSTEEFQYKHPKINCMFDVRYYVWGQKLHEEYSKYYYLNSKDKEQYKENTTLNNKGDKFYHSVYIKSALFDNFTFEELSGQISFSASKDSEAYKWVIRQIDVQLRTMRNPFIKQYTGEYVTELKKKGVYPKLNSQNYFDKFREDSLDEMIQAIYAAEPKIFSSLNLTQQKTLVRLFDLTLQSGEVDSLYKIIEGVLDMPVCDRDELANLLEYTEMSYITKTISLIKDRMQAISDLKELVLNEDLKANERDHLQKLIEKHYWIFGEEYYLVTAEEPDFEEALRRFLYVLRGEDNPKGSIHIDSEHRQKEMDIFAVQRKMDGMLKKSIVVELKHPRITLSSKELQQVKNYFGVIDKEPRFNASNIEWVFFLVGNAVNDEIEGEYENASSHGERCLVYKRNNKKIYVKKWSDIFTEAEINYNFLHEKLQLKQQKLIDLSRKKTANEIAQEQQPNTAVRPQEAVI